MHDAAKTQPMNHRRRDHMIKTDREQIEELMSTYGQAIDAKNYDGVAACFAPDAIVEYTGYSQHLKGHKDIVGFMRQALEPLDGTHHMFANFIINVERECGDFTCGVLAQHWLTGAPGGDTYL